MNVSIDARTDAPDSSNHFATGSIVRQNIWVGYREALSDRNGFGVPYCHPLQEGNSVHRGAKVRVRRARHRTGWNGADQDECKTKERSCWPGHQHSRGAPKAKPAAGWSQARLNAPWKVNVRNNRGQGHHRCGNPCVTSDSIGEMIRFVSLLYVQTSAASSSVGVAELARIVLYGTVYRDRITPQGVTLLHSLYYCMCAATDIGSRAT